jgi:cytoskeletal protein RodZ
MAAFGENLRREREMRGVSLEEISTATKISMRFLQAIENEDFAKLPGGIFTRSFIRTYARYLGLDEERVLAEYHLAAQPKADFDLHRLSASRPTPRRGVSRASLLGILFIAAIFAGGYALFRYSRRAAEVLPNPMSQARVATAPASGPVSTPQTSTPPPTSTMATGAPATGTVAGSGSSSSPSPGAATSPGAPAAAAATNVPRTDTGLVLQVAATEQTWVAIEADGKTALQRVLNPQEVETLKARESFDVTTGNAQGIILTLNGETLKPLGRRGEVKSVHLTHDDLKNPAP